jgi:3-hydroxybutyryl-CoA dehydrogenase
MTSTAVIGPGRIGRQIALALALGGCQVRLVDLKPRAAPNQHAALADAGREILRDLTLMVEEGVIVHGEIAATMERIEAQVGLDGLQGVGFIQEALPEVLELKRVMLARLSAVVDEDAIIACGSSTISPKHLVEFVRRPERFVAAHWLNPAHIIPLVEVVAAPGASETVVARTLQFLESLGKTPVRCGDSPGFIGPRLQVLLMNEAVRLVEEGVASPEDVDKAFKAGMGFRYGTIGLFEFIDWGGVDILHRASGFMAKAMGDDRFKPAKLVDEKVANNELGPKTGRGFFDYAGDKRETFETEKLRALLRQLKRQRRP